MKAPRGLHHLVEGAAARAPDALALCTADGAVTYGALDALSNRLGRALVELGVGPGDRVGFWLNKSIESIATMQAALRVGAAYVPLDPTSPSARVMKISRDCGLAVIVTSAERADLLDDGLHSGTRIVTVGESGRAALSWSDLDAYDAKPLVGRGGAGGDLAYVLYTSGSTGTPKGVCISHDNALAFVDWAVDELGASAADHFANHAPFHFDLSVLDLYAAFAAGARVSLIPETVAYSAPHLVELVVRD